MYLYIPGPAGMGVPLLARAGLEELASDGDLPYCADLTHGGPDGGQGVLCAWDDPKSPGIHLAYSPDTQDWTAVEEGRYWLGRPKQGTITPRMLARRRQYQGLDVTLGDGQVWHVPLARQLPQVFGLGGRMVKPAYKRFWDEAWRILEEWLVIRNAGPSWEIPWDEAFEFAALALSHNYRVNATILRWLAAIDTDNLVAVLDAATDGWHMAAMMLAIEKKNRREAPGGEPTSGGGVG